MVEWSVTVNLLVHRPNQQRPVSKFQPCSKSLAPSLWHLAFNNLVLNVSKGLCNGVWVSSIFATHPCWLGGLRISEVCCSTYHRHSACAMGTCQKALLIFLSNEGKRKSPTFTSESFKLKVKKMLHFLLFFSLKKLLLNCSSFLSLPFSRIRFLLLIFFPHFFLLPAPVLTRANDDDTRFPLPFSTPKKKPRRKEKPELSIDLQRERSIGNDPCEKFPHQRSNIFFFGGVTGRHRRRSDFGCRGVVAAWISKFPAWKEGNPRLLMRNKETTYLELFPPYSKDSRHLGNCLEEKFFYQSDLLRLQIKHSSISISPLIQGTKKDEMMNAHFFFLLKFCYHQQPSEAVNNKFSRQEKKLVATTLQSKMIRKKVHEC